MNMAEYLTELKNILNKINRQSYTEIKMLESKKLDELTKDTIGPDEIGTLDKAKKALSMVNEILVNL